MTEETAAADDAGSKDQIDMKDRASVDRWATALGTTAEALESAVQAVGPRVDRVKDHLAAGGASDQEGG
ncbi:MAG: hypothetical protein JWQ11_1502 [Rhizobacter sp.]|nr:hypothetical protein [Rhizobacter sp.]